MTKRILIVITLIIMICFMQTLGIYFNTKAINKLRDEVKQEGTGVWVCQKPRETIAKAEDVIDITRCNDGWTSIEVWTYTDGNMDVVINGE